MIKLDICIIFEYPETINNMNVLLGVIELIWMTLKRFYWKSFFLISMKHIVVNMTKIIFASVLDHLLYHYEFHYQHINLKWLELDLFLC